ncbi:MAG: glycoside hydrolase family 20 zincin-like fold domain-containing protein [Chitinophagaceae bacterium]
MAQRKGLVTIVNTDTTARAKFGVEKLASALKQSGYAVKFVSTTSKVNKNIIIGKPKPGLACMDSLSLPGWSTEGYAIAADKQSDIYIGAKEPSGILYACLELMQLIKDNKQIPATINIADKPEMVLRGACIGVQKPYYLPGHNVYEYPYTPETFPWFYDKQLWIQYLDSMVANRMNSLYLWNGHPFASLVKLKDYPYAVEVDEATFKKNEEIYRFLTTEADKRGIWVIQMFYNIIVSKPFADYNHIKTQDRDRPIIPLIADYTRKSIAAFVEKYPNVGLMVCLGEAMEGVGNDDIEWFTKTIIPGVQDGLKALHQTKEPPIVLRAHDTDAPAVMNAALPLYKNLYTEAKFNGEALTYQRPRGSWAALHQTLSRLGSVQIENVHIMANLEPFRYGAVDFIQESVIGMHEVMGGNGLHLYPQASYWDWPYTADSVKGKRLLQIERDWIWYAAWARYAWKANRDKKNEAAYWNGMLAAKYGCNMASAQNIITAYEQSGEIAPKLLRRFGITDGNRQTMTLGMLMTQLINPNRYGLFTLLYESESPEGEMLIQYAEKEWKKQPHVGETPPQIIREVKDHADKAVAAIDAAANNVTANKEEFARLRNDVYCYQALAYHFAFKAEAALHILRYKYSNDVKDLQQALPLLEKSMDYYRKLADLTKGTYLYANSMQTQQRKIPMRGVNGTFKTWVEMLVPFQQELDHFKHAIDSLKQQPVNTTKQVKTLQNADVVFKNDSFNFYSIDSLAKLYADTSFTIMDYAKELKGLKGLALNFNQQLQQNTDITFTTNQPVKLLVGYFNPKGTVYAKQPIYLKAPELETNATANDYGQAETKIANALSIKGMPPVNVHSYSFPAGEHTLHLTKGVCLVLGFVNGNQAIPLYDAGLTENGVDRQIDWLFE